MAYFGRAAVFSKSVLPRPRSNPEAARLQRQGPLSARLGVDVGPKIMNLSPLSKPDQPRQTLLLDRAHPPLRVGVQIWRPRQSGYPRDLGRVDELLKGGVILPIPGVFH